MNNIVYKNSGNPFVGIGKTVVLTNNLTTDPKFVNVGALDFRLQSSSPAIDKGATLTAVPRDIRGYARPRGRYYDIGAYEY